MVSGTDRIALDHGVFTGLGFGALNANAFVIGTAAGDADAASSTTAPERRCCSRCSTAIRRSRRATSP
jgi:hypothetical protein